MNSNPDLDKYFEGSLFKGPTRLARQIDRLLQNNTESGWVIAVNGSWGSGKTWFATRLMEYFESEDGKNSGYRGVYYRADEFDTETDPLPSLVANLTKLINSRSKTKSIRAAMGPVLKNLVPSLAKAGGTFVVNKITNSPESTAAIAEALKSGLDDAIDRQTEKWMKEASNQTKILENLRKKIKDACKDSDTKFVFIIDELDRCTPDFAIQVIERVRHFFGDSNCNFLILVNRDQLELNLKHKYGETVDAEGYLYKYVDLWIPYRGADNDPIVEVVEHFFEEIRISEFYNTQLLEEITLGTAVFGLTMRSLERVKLQLVHWNKESRILDEKYVGFLACLKIADPKCFSMLGVNTQVACQARQKIENKVKASKVSDQNSHYFETWRYLDASLHQIEKLNSTANQSESQNWRDMKTVYEKLKDY
jgi:hypothetical protein